jgi:hypothetical protein
MNAKAVAETPSLFFRGMASTLIAARARLLLRVRAYLGSRAKRGLCGTGKRSKRYDARRESVGKYSSPSARPHVEQ